MSALPLIARYTYRRECITTAPDAFLPTLAACCISGCHRRAPVPSTRPPRHSHMHWDTALGMSIQPENFQRESLQGLTDACAAGREGPIFLITQTPFIVLGLMRLPSSAPARRDARATSVRVKRDAPFLLGIVPTHLLPRENRLSTFSSWYRRPALAATYVFCVCVGLVPDAWVYLWAPRSATSWGAAIQAFSAEMRCLSVYVVCMRSTWSCALPLSHLRPPSLRTPTPRLDFMHVFLPEQKHDDVHVQINVVCNTHRHRLDRVLPRTYELKRLEGVTRDGAHGGDSSSPVHYIPHYVAANTIVDLAPDVLGFRLDPHPAP
ncbi:hypothetical protein C8R45DRAFT_1112465 [Mycena sanguinolenta]|nr:hypothetical protein C8R45DRAFT_1112465 [Mycena sanguinolenta]